MKNPKGFITPLITAIVTIGCFCVIGYYKLIEKQDDSVIEKIAEGILEEEGVEINFATKESKT